MPVDWSTLNQHSHIGPISALCRNIDVGFRYRADIGPIYIIALLSIFSNYWVFNGLLMLIHLVFYIVNISHKCASRLINIKSILFAICTIAYFTFAPFIREFEFRRDLKSNGDSRKLKKINLLSGNFMYSLNTFIRLYWRNDSCLYLNRILTIS